MPQQVISGAITACSFGMAPSTLVVQPVNRTLCGGTPAANIMDFVPMLNIQPFAMCMSPANPTVIAATAAAMGVPTPMPCIPATTTPWTPGAPTVLIGGQPALDNVSTCPCMWGGVVQITFPGQIPTEIP